MPDQLTLGIIIAAALADSINPCVFGVLIFLLAYMMTVFKSKTKMLLGAIVYISTVYLTYFLLGIGILTLASTAGFAKPFYKIAASIAILAGLVEIKDFFWYGKWFSLQMIPGASERLEHYIKWMQRMEIKRPSLSFLIAGLLGIFVVFVELPCTGAPYLAILGLLSTGNYAEGIPLLLLYNFVFILPLIFIVGLVYFGHTSRKLEKWRKKNRGLMRLGIGIFLILLGAYMFWAII